MTARRIASLIAGSAAALCLMAALVLPVGGPAAARLVAAPIPLGLVLASLAALALAAWHGGLAAIPLHAAASLCASLGAILLLSAPNVAGAADLGFWAIVAAAWIAAVLTVVGLAGLKPAGALAKRGLDVAVPFLFGVFLFFLWEILVRGFGVSGVLMPPPSAVATRFFTSLPILGPDFVQTVVRGVLTGYVIGSAAGFLAAIVADRVPFLRRGLLPLANFAAALPVVGIAPIMVMWFGFDWPSKAAVVVVMTFFPMLVNAVAGLAAAGTIERDLMRSYGASYWQTLLKLRLPAAMPFIFNALKINSTLALIGAIVAEFFGTPIVGMGFRISIEVARMSLDMVWAEIALAAIAGTVFYGAIALAERATTFWHPSYRG
jgi:NitT/TauT family transport system permease protein